MTKQEYYLSIAEAVAKKSTCLRRKYGAIIVKNDEIISTGYNGSPRGCPNCNDYGICLRTFLKAKKGEDYNMCLSVHAEMNAMISAKREDMIGSTIYVVGLEMEHEGYYADPNPCLLCHRMMINSGIEKAYGMSPGPIDSPEGGVYVMDISKERFMKRICELYEKQISSLPMDKATMLIEYIDRMKSACN